ncbi:DNA replication licensing factor [Venturia inaequalis]|nr:DNA replication licensing factor [Venturia inaequalis]
MQFLHLAFVALNFSSLSSAQGLYCNPAPANCAHGVENSIWTPCDHSTSHCQTGQFCGTKKRHQCCLDFDKGMMRMIEYCY